MAKLTMGRRILKAVSAAIPVSLVLWTVGTVATGAMPGVFPANFDIICGAIGFGACIAEQFVEDTKAKEQE